MRADSQASMLRARFIVATLAVALLAAACGGDDPEDDPAGLKADTSTVSEVATEDIDSPSDSTESATPEQADSDAERAAEPDPATQPGPEPEPVPVRLGGRFGWCSDVQEDFDEMAEHQAAVAAAEADLQDALETLDASTDELDQVEAQRDRDAAAEQLDWLRGQGAVRRAARWLFLSGLRGQDEARRIAFDRALTAYHEAANPDVSALVWASVDLQAAQDHGALRPLPGTALSFDVYLPHLFPDTTGTEPVLTPEEALAAIADYEAQALAVVDKAVETQTDGWQAFQAAETTREMLAALTVIAQASITLEQAQDAASAGRTHADSVLNPDGNPRHRDVYFASRDAVAAVSEATWTEVNFLDIERRIEALALGEEAGLDAFWRSLAESCQPN